MNIIIFLIAVWDYSYNFATDATYDNNIFSYSSEYIDDFMNQVSPYRFPFETYDDLITSGKLNLFLRNKFFNRRTTTFNIGIKINHYLTNNQKDYQRINIGLRQSFGKIAAKVSYQIIPNYLIRYYRNSQGSSTDYIGCEVKYQTVSGKLSFSPKPSVLFYVQYKRRWDDYIPEFDIYDANGHILSIDSEIKLNKRITLSLGYAFRSSEADSLEIPTTNDEDFPDGSYYQHSLKGNLIFQFKTLFPTKLSCGYNYNFRNFTTTFADDAMHFGRQDHIHKITASTEFRIFTRMFLEISYLGQLRNATSEVLPSIDTIKDYNKYRLGAGLHFYY